MAVTAALVIIGSVILFLRSVHSLDAPTMPPACTSACLTVNHSLWGTALRDFTRPHVSIAGHNTTFVRYSDLLRARTAATPDPLTAYLQVLAAAPLARLDMAERKALMLNAYNALAITMLLNNPCSDGKMCASITDISTVVSPVWKRAAGVVGGLTYSLDNIEHQYLRPTYQDPRLHSALNCASASCPPLLRVPFHGGTVEAQLNGTAAAWLGSDNGIAALDTATHTLTVSKIFSWYASDFEHWWARGGRVGFIQAFAPPSIAAYIEGRRGGVALTFASYDWNLNGE